MRKVNAKKKSKREKENSSGAKDHEYQDNKNGGLDESSEDATQEREKKFKKGIAERAKADNGIISEVIEEEEYEVEDIVDHKLEGGISCFLIKWKGYDSTNNTWEPEDTLSCPELVNKFKKKAKRPKQTKGEHQHKKKTKLNVENDQTSEDPNQEWEVERVVDVTYGKNGARLFRIRWKGYRSTSDTWEPVENLNCKDLIEKFLKKHDEESKLSQKELREAPRQTKRFVTDTFGRRSSKRNSGRLRTVYFDAE